MKELSLISSNVDKNSLVIEYDLSNICNYACWYCFPGAHEGTDPWPDYDLAVQNITHLINYYRTQLGKERIIINLLGGEPTLWKRLGEFIQHLKKELGCIITVNTNGSRTLRWWTEYGINFDRVILSVHHERADIQHIIDVADLLYRHDIIVEANVLMDPTAWDRCVEIVEQLKNSRNDWLILSNEVRINNQLNYTDDQLAYLDNRYKRWPNPMYYINNTKLQFKRYWARYSDNSIEELTSNQFLLKGYRNFKGWECDLGVEELYISRQGRLSGVCGNSLYNDKYYNLYDVDFVSTFAPTITPTICQQDMCSCEREIVLKKRVIPIQPI